MKKIKKKRKKTVFKSTKDQIQVLIISKTKSEYFKEVRKPRSFHCIVLLIHKVFSNIELKL